MNTRPLISRNKREGRYAGWYQSRHARSGKFAGNKSFPSKSAAANMLSLRKPQNY